MMNTESFGLKPAGAKLSRQGGWKRIAFLVFTGLLGAGAVIPVIVDFALYGHLTWSLYSLGAVVMAWLILAPWFVFPRNRALISWGAMVLTLPLYLGLVESLAPVKGWLLPLGLPAAALGLAALGGIIAVWYCRKIGPWYAVALTFSILAILSLAEYLVARPFLVWDVPGSVFRVIALCVGGSSTMLFVIAFLMHQRRAS
jgi:hypothetical protein